MTPRFSQLEDLLRKDWIVIGSALAAIAAIGILVAAQPLVALVFSGLTVFLLLIGLGERIGPIFLGSLGLLLTGYVILGRGFAYFGAPPLFVGEMVLGLAVLALLYSIGKWRIDLISGVIILMMTLGALRTLPYIGEHGISALRDAVLWGYAFFALAVAAVLRRHHVDEIVHWYGKLVPVIILLAPFAMFARTVAAQIPNTPGTDVPLIDVKPGDMGVHLAGAGAFLLLGLWSRRSEYRSVLEIVLWPIWLVGIAMSGSFNRGGLTAAMSAVAVTLLLSPTRKITTAIFAAALLITAVAFVNPSVELTRGRDVSLGQLATNVSSLIVDTGRGDLEGTREWRIDWWTDIVNYTVRGEYFWTGKGFGINLADSDGYQVMEDGSLRAPHSSHMSVLARMGVPGAAVWIILQLGFGIAIVSAIFRAQRRQDQFWGLVLIWIFAYWLAMIVNSSFDVYLEGPQGGIWFWAIFGLGIAAVRMEREEDEAHSRNKSGQRRPAGAASRRRSLPVGGSRGDT